MPEAFSMNSGDDSFSGSCVCAAIASAWRALSRRTKSVNATHSAAFESECGGCQTPQPVIVVPVVVRGDMLGASYGVFESRASQRGARSWSRVPAAVHSTHSGRFGV